MVSDTRWLPEDTQPSRGRLLAPPHDAYPRFPGWKHLGRRIPYLLSQFAMFFVAFQGYKFVRKIFIPPDPKVAFDNAIDILNLEERFHTMFELRLQQWWLEQPLGWILAINRFYSWYMWVVIGSLVFLALMSPRRYRYMRRAFFISMTLALPMYLIYPLAPPRFMADYGWNFVDAMAKYGPNYFSEKGIVAGNRYAAMPSMHVGWTTFAALCVSMAVPNKVIGRVIAAAMVALISFTVVVTGNHYWLDGAVGWVLILTAITINALIPFPWSRRYRWNPRTWLRPRS